MSDWSRQGQLFCLGPLALTPRVFLQREAAYGAWIKEIYGVLRIC